MPDPGTAEPRTEAGKALVEAWGGDGGHTNIAGILAIEEQAALEARDEYAETTGIGVRAVALIADLRAHGLQPGDGDRLVIVALSQAATEARRELLAKVEAGDFCPHCYAEIVVLIEERSDA